MVTYGALGNYGEFGNQLFQIAATIGYADKCEQDYIFPSWRGERSGNMYSKYFDSHIPEITSHDITFTTYHEPEFNYNEIPINLNQHTNLHGYFQSEKYFENSIDKIVNTFKPVSSIIDRLKEIDYTNSVCIQLRFYDNTRDYTNWNSVVDPPYSHMFFSVDDNMEYYNKAIEYFGDNKNYFITTNNIDRAKALFGHLKNCNFLEGYDYMDQFFIQTLCENNIISNSSFGWWGAYLNSNTDKVVFAPKQWFKPGGWHIIPNTVDLYPESWRIH